MSQNLNVLCVSFGSNCFCIISSYLLATKWSQFGVPSHGQLAVSGTVTLSCRAWFREGSQGLALVKSQLRAGCAWLCCQSHLAPGWDKARPWPLLAVLQCGERGECVSPPLWCPQALAFPPALALQQTITPALPGAKPWPGSASHCHLKPLATPAQLIPVTRHQVMFWLSHIIYYCLYWEYFGSERYLLELCIVPEWRNGHVLVIGSVCCKSNKNISDEVESGMDWL